MAALRSRSSRAGPVRQLRLFVARRPLVHWLLIGLAAVLTGAFVYSRAAGAEDARHRWGTARPVVVAVHDLAAGHRIVPGDVRRRSWPAALLPSGALSSLEEGAVVAAPVVAGEPVLRNRLGRARAGPVAAALSPGRRAVTIPVGDTPPSVAAGDQVDLVAAGSAPAAQVVAHGASVMAVDERAVVVAVTTDELPAVAGGLVDGTVVVAVSGDPPGGP
jgi:Flp pilus assembly protein CpaB